jgi:3-deoxy-7-phosphoheptulonate synthase
MNIHQLPVRNIHPLIPPAHLIDELTLTERGAVAVRRARREVTRIIDGQDDRLLVIVGPCSIHDPVAGHDYASRLRRIRDRLAPDLLIVMRAYFEKPRTTIGWKGLINDPGRDSSFAVNQGLRLARKFLLDLAEIGMPAGCEFLDPISWQFTADLVAWGAIGARTSESQVHRELASGLPVPVGFKNGTEANVQIAIDAVRTAAHPHCCLGMTEHGQAAIVSTPGNPACHIVLRGGTSGPNHDAISVANALTTLVKSGLPPRLMIDTSHGNCGKDHRRQPLVARDVAQQIAQGEPGIMGIMIESFLTEGRQEFPGLVYGQSITDPCVGWGTTVDILHELAEAVRTRRSVQQEHELEGQPAAAD